MSGEEATAGHDDARARERRAQLRAGLAMTAVAALLGVAGLLVGDERLRILLWLLAAPMLLAGLVPLAWGNATREVDRLRRGRG
jgi:hypothetical protein